MIGFKRTTLAVMVATVVGLAGTSQASLTVTANGLGVFDSGLSATWTQDANLLGTLENTQGYNTVVNAVIAASNGVIYDTPNAYDTSGAYTLNANDFGIGGTVDWWAGQAYVHYLDSINYGGSNQWALPTVSGNSFVELFYYELDGRGLSSPPSDPFSNLLSYSYWDGTEYASSYSGSSNNAYMFWFNGGNQYSISKANLLNVWAVSSGDVSAPVLIPGAVWLFGSGLGLFTMSRWKSRCSA